MLKFRNLISLRCCLLVDMELPVSALKMLAMCNIAQISRINWKHQFHGVAFPLGLCCFTTLNSLPCIACCQYRIGSSKKLWSKNCFQQWWSFENSQLNWHRFDINFMVRYALSRLLGSCHKKVSYSEGNQIDETLLWWKSKALKTYREQSKSRRNESFVVVAFFGFVVVVFRFSYYHKHQHHRFTIIVITI